MKTPMAGERLRTLRDLLGITQVELAEAAGVPQPRISEIELGVREATEEILDLIATATATPRSFFDVYPPDLPLGTLRFRKLAAAKRGDTKRVKALFNEAYRVATDLLVEASYPQPCLPVATATNVTDLEIERLATEIREALQIDGDGPITHLTRAIERAGVAVAPLTLPGDHGGEDEAIGHFGVSHWPGPGEHALIGYFTGGPGDRQRYTLAHELAHLVLHSRRRTPLDPESEANRLAGAILMPYDRAIEVFDRAVTLRDLARIKATWGISIQALIMRGGHVGKVDDARKTSLFKQLSARGWRKTEPVVVHPEDPMLLWRLLKRTYGEPVPYQKVADKVGLNAVVVRSLSPHPAAKSRPTSGPPMPKTPSRSTRRASATVSDLSAARARHRSN